MLAASQIVNRYGDFEHGICIEYFGKKAKEKPITLAAACYVRTPTLAMIDIAYGENSALTWMYAHMVLTLSYVGIKDKMSDAQIVQCARHLCSRRPDVTVLEMLQFFSRFEQGIYERFVGYSNPNPQVITSSFESFLDDLNIARGVAEQYRQSQRLIRQARESKRNAVPCPPDVAEHISKENLPIKTNNDNE